MAKTKFGYMKCETRKCINGDEGPGRVVVMVNEHGTMSYRCDECGASPYAHKGTGKYDAWVRDSEKAAASPPAPKPAPEAKPAPKPKPDPEPKPAPAPKKKAPGSLLEAAEG